MVKDSQMLQYDALLQYFFHIDGRKLDDDEYSLEVGKLMFCLNKLGFTDTREGHTRV